MTIFERMEQYENFDLEPDKINFYQKMYDYLIENEDIEEDDLIEDFYLYEIDSKNIATFDLIILKSDGTKYGCEYKIHAGY